MNGNQEYIGVVNPFAGKTIPKNWLPCDGRMLNKLEYEGLYNVIGTTYGSDGEFNFAIPDLRACIVFGKDIKTNMNLGHFEGEESVNINTKTLALHLHISTALNIPATTDSPSDSFLTVTPNLRYCIRDNGDTLVPMSMGIISMSPQGASQPHNNMPPFLVTNYIICCNGEYPYTSPKNP